MGLTTASVTIGQGLNFAIPVADLRTLITNGFRELSISDVRRRMPIRPLKDTVTEANEVSFQSVRLVLNGITSGAKRTAMINGRTFEAGEEGEVKVSSGVNLRIRCVEVKDRSAVVEVGGERRALYMRGGL